MKFVLLVTLIVAGQKPYSYQVEFSSEAQCNNAERAVIEFIWPQFSQSKFELFSPLSSKGALNSN